MLFVIPRGTWSASLRPEESKVSSAVDPAKEINDLIAGLDDWRNQTLAQAGNLSAALFKPSRRSSNGWAVRSGNLTASSR